MSYSFNKVCSNVIPVGSYKVQIQDIKFKTSSSGTATNDLVVMYLVADGVSKGKTFSETISEKAFSFKLKKFLSGVGVDMSREFATAQELYNYGISSAKGKFLMVELGIRTYNGNEYNQVNDYAPLPSSSTSVEDVLSEFGASPNITPSMPKVTDLPDPEASNIDTDTASSLSDLDDIL